MIALLYRLLAIAAGSLWLLYWSAYLAISRSADAGPKRESIRIETVPRYRMMVKWGLGV